MRVSRAEGCALVRLGGEMDVAGSAEARAFLAAALVEGRGRVVVDATDLAFIDASGLGVLVFAAARANRDDGWLRLVGASAMLRRMLGIAQLTAVLCVYDSVDAATSPGC